MQQGTHLYDRARRSFLSGTSGGARLQLLAPSLRRVTSQARKLVCWGSESILTLFWFDLAETKGSAYCMHRSDTCFPTEQSSHLLCLPALHSQEGREPVTERF